MGSELSLEHGPRGVLQVALCVLKQWSIWSTEHSQLLGIDFFGTSCVTFQKVFEFIKAQYHSKHQKREIK